MRTITYQEVLQRAQKLTPDEQLQLLADLAAIIRQQTILEPLHDVLEFEGVGAEVWKGIDAQKYIDEERDSWSG
jgi:hypothetical protein